MEMEKGLEVLTELTFAKLKGGSLPERGHNADRCG